MRRLLLAALLCLLPLSASWAAGTVSNLPNATVPLGNVGDEMLIDQGAGCPTNTNPCSTFRVPSLRVGQPVLTNCASISSPFTYQWCYDNSVTPVVWKQYFGGQWWPLFDLDNTLGPSLAASALPVIPSGTVLGNSSGVTGPATALSTLPTGLTIPSATLVGPTLSGILTGGTLEPGNPLAILYGGTGATTAAGARQNLGVPAHIWAGTSTGSASTITVADPTDLTSLIDGSQLLFNSGVGVGLSPVTVQVTGVGSPTPLLRPDGFGPEGWEAPINSPAATVYYNGAHHLLAPVIPLHYVGLVTPPGFNFGYPTAVQDPQSMFPWYAERSALWGIRTGSGGFTTDTNLQPIAAKFPNIVIPCNAAPTTTYPCNETATLGEYLNPPSHDTSFGNGAGRLQWAFAPTNFGNNAGQLQYDYAPTNCGYYAGAGEIGRQDNSCGQHASFQALGGLDSSSTTLTADLPASGATTISVSNAAPWDPATLGITGAFTDSTIYQWYRVGLEIIRGSFINSTTLSIIARGDALSVPQAHKAGTTIYRITSEGQNEANGTYAHGFGIGKQNTLHGHYSGYTLFGDLNVGDGYRTLAGSIATGTVAAGFEAGVSVDTTNSLMLGNGATVQSMFAANPTFVITTKPSAGSEATYDQTVRTAQPEPQIISGVPVDSAIHIYWPAGEGANAPLVFDPATAYGWTDQQRVAIIYSFSGSNPLVRLGSQTDAPVNWVFRRIANTTLGGFDEYLIPQVGNYLCWNGSGDTDDNPCNFGGIGNVATPQVSTPGAYTGPPNGNSVTWNEPGQFGDNTYLNAQPNGGFTFTPIQHVDNAIALGSGSTAAFSGSIALGVNVSTAAVNQLMLGSNLLTAINSGSFAVWYPPKLISGGVVTSNGDPFGLSNTEVIGNGATSSNSLNARFSADGTGPFSLYIKSRGTISSTGTVANAAVSAGDLVGSMRGEVDDGTTVTAIVASVDLGAASTPTGAGMAFGQIDLRTVNGDNTLHSRFRVDQTGNLCFAATGNGCPTGNVLVDQNGQVFDQAQQFSNILGSGGTIIVADTNDALILNPASTLTTVTVQLPTCSASYGGKRVIVSSSHPIVPLSVTATAGSVVGAPAALNSGSVGPGMMFLCRVIDTTWYRML